MAVDKYLNQDGLSHVADYVNRKLTVVSSMPSSPTDLRTVIYIGATTEDYVQGGLYLYNEEDDEWNLVSVVDVDLYETSWTGPQDEWNALSSDEQAKYEIVNFTDDFVPGTDDHVVSGYYYEGKFYEDVEHASEITGLEGFIYIDLPNDELYLYDAPSDKFVLAGGSGGVSSIVQGYYYNGDFYEDSAHSILIAPNPEKTYVDLEGNAIYRYDNVEMKYISIGGGSSLTAGFGVSIENDEIKTTDFVGTQAQWDALTDDQKAAYDFIHTTDDSSDVNYSPGHSISDGTSEKTQREILEFEGFTVTDDSTNGKTKVAEIPYTAGDGVDITNKEISVSDDISRTWTGTKAAWDAIADKSVYDGWIINITDDQAVGSYIEDAVTEGSLNAVTSGAVYDAFEEKAAQVVPNTGTTTFSKLIQNGQEYDVTVDVGELINANMSFVQVYHQLNIPLTQGTEYLTLTPPTVDGAKAMIPTVMWGDFTKKTSHNVTYALQGVVYSNGWKAIARVDATASGWNVSDTIGIAWLAIK